MTEMRGYPPPDPQDHEPDAAFTAVAFVLFLLIASALLSQCSNAKAAPPPFLINLPDGTQQQACTARYEPTAKVYDFGQWPCVTVFADSFEGDRP